VKVTSPFDDFRIFSIDPLSEQQLNIQVSDKFAPYQFALRREVPDRDRIECDQTDRFCFNAVF
jgi:hypothetical protein